MLASWRWIKGLVLMIKFGSPPVGGVMNHKAHVTREVTAGVQPELALMSLIAFPFFIILSFLHLRLANRPIFSIWGHKPSDKRERKDSVGIQTITAALRSQTNALETDKRRHRCLIKAGTHTARSSCATTVATWNQMHKHAIVSESTGNCRHTS